MFIWGHQEVYCNTIEMNVALDNNIVVDFPANKKSCISFKFKQQVIGQTGNDGTKNV